MRAVLLLSASLLLAGAPAARAQGFTDSPFDPEPPVPTYANPVLAGEYPDPSVTWFEGSWWAVVSSGVWRPPFTVLRSDDLVNWEVAGSALRRQPGWARRDFWAPELTRGRRGFLLYYAARNRHRRMCLAVASAPHPAGPFRDRGRLTCRWPGAIDPMPVRDRGRRYLIFKREGNPRDRPTPLVAARLSRDGLRLRGRPRELFRNRARWEGHVVEAPALTRRDGMLYLFYSARRCCGARCTYATGVARARRLLGPWRKHRGPILAGNRSFRCPGHASVVHMEDGEQFLAYHAYGRGAGIVGRQLLLDRLEWAEDGWPVVNGGEGPSSSAPSPVGVSQRPQDLAVDERFRRRRLRAGWQWPLVRPALRVDPRAGGRLLVRTARSDGAAVPGVIGWQPGLAAYVAETVVSRLRGGARPGLAVYARPRRALGIEVHGRRIVTWRAAGRGRRRLAAARLRGRGLVELRVRVRSGRFSFLARRAGGRWKRVGRRGLRPPWGVFGARVALHVYGGRGARAGFEHFRLRPLD